MNDVIEALGGPPKVAAALGISRTRVANWRNRGIPWQFRPAIAEMLRAAHRDVPSDLQPPKPRAA